MKNLTILENNEILKKTLSEMPLIFTSQQFNKKALENGYPTKIFNETGTGFFLRIWAKNDKIKTKTWVKISENERKKRLSKSLIDDLVDENPNSQSQIKEAIDLLKREGYKIMKPVNQWEEI